MLKRLRAMCEKKKILLFSIIWGFFALALFVEHYDSAVNEINATMLAFSYKYGFISRGFIGTVFQFANSVLPYNLLNYTGVMHFTRSITIIFFVILFAFFISCIMKSKLEITEEIKYAIIFFTIYAIPMFVTVDNFGRLDIYCVMLSLLSAILLIWEKAEWLVVVLSAISIMIHQGNVFMFMNIVLVLLIYKMFSDDKKRQRKYASLFIITFLVVSALFVYFEFFSHMNGQNIYEDIVSTASAICNKGEYHVDVIDHEILGVDLGPREAFYRKVAFAQLPFYIILTFPFIIISFLFFRNIIKKQESKLQKLKYILVSAGALTILPNFILKCDYGRWIFAVVCYYCVTILSLLAMKDQVVEEELKSLIGTIQSKYSWAILLLAYAVLIQPLDDVQICPITDFITSTLNQYLHWW